MSAPARIKARIRPAVTAITAVLWCGFALPAQAQAHNFSYLQPGLDDADTVNAPPPAAAPPLAAKKAGLQILCAPASAKDSLFAARPSPYSAVAGNTVNNAAPVAVTAKHTQAPMTVMASAPQPLPRVMSVVAVAKPAVPAATRMAADTNFVWFTPRKHEPVAAPAPQMLAAAAPAPDPSIAQRKAYALKAGNIDLASMLTVARQSALGAAGAASAAEANIQLAAADTKPLSALAPAAGEPAAVPQPVPGGPITPAPTLELPPETAPLPPVGLPVPPMPPASAVPSPMPAPVTPETLSEPNPQRHLSPQSKAIADKLPPQIPRNQPKPPVRVEHFQKNPLENEEVREHQGVGISISVRRPSPNVSHMLEEAYDALIVGNQEDAIAMYKEVLANQPDNKLALFGLATTYHRAGQTQLARPLYGRLLAIDPNNEEGLNNFLVLLSDESPTEALGEMKRLEQTHPAFSPLPAQMAVVYDKLGEYDAAIHSMKHAIDLSPENIKYRYDMAVMLDKEGDWDDAAVYYQELITAHERGEKIPAKAEEIQERLTFIRSNKPTIAGRN